MAEKYPYSSRHKAASMLLGTVFLSGCAANNTSAPGDGHPIGGRPEAFQCDSAKEVGGGIFVQVDGVDHPNRHEFVSKILVRAIYPDGHSDRFSAPARSNTAFIAPLEKVDAVELTVHAVKGPTSMLCPTVRGQ